MHARIRLSILLALGVSILSGNVWADEIVFKSGEIRQGRVENVRGEPNRVAYISASGRLEIPRQLIEEIKDEPDEVDYTIVGDQFVKNRSYETAIKMYQKALEADPDYTIAKDGIEKARKLIGEQQAEIQRRVAEENSGLLGKARDEISQEKFAEAERTIDQIAQQATPQQAAAVQLIRRDLYVAWGLSRIDRLDPIGAEEYFQEALKIDPDNATAREGLLRVWENDPSKREEVLAAYKLKLKDNPDDLILQQKVADILLAQQRFEDAIPHLMKLEESGKFSTSRYDDRLKNAFEQIVMRQVTAGDLAAAVKTYKQRMEVFPDTDPMPLAFLEYQKKLNDLAPNDWDGRAGLLDDLERQGLNTLAVQEAQTILRGDPENETALAFLRKDAVSQLQDIRQMFENGEFFTARERARTFIENNPRFPELIQQANDIYTKADIEAERQARRISEQAREIAERGDQYLSQARRYAELMKNRETTERTTVLSYKQEAIKFANRAIETYQTALKIDPSLGPITGMDVNTKLADARSLLGNLTRAPYQRPTRQMRPLVSEPEG
ncbi:tetratricopeptide repeat protein [bacterium]|nr:tetratricopeptide repeat protein [bacterium]